MSDNFLSLSLFSHHNINMDKLKEQLNKVGNLLFIDYDYFNNDFDDVSYDNISGLKLTLRKVTKFDALNVINNLKSNDILKMQLLKSIQIILINNEQLFCTSEILSHGFTYSEVLETIKMAAINLKQLLNFPSCSQLDKIDSIVYIELENDNLLSLIIKIVNNINKKIVLIPAEIEKRFGHCLSAFLLVYLLHKENADLKNKITFLFPKTQFYTDNSVICTESWIDFNRDQLNSEVVYNVEYNERKSCFLIFNNSNLFSAVVNYVNLLGGSCLNTRKVPKLCLVQESIYLKFIDMLKNYLINTKVTKLLDKNRKISVNHSENTNEIIDLLSLIRKESGINILSVTEPCADYDKFYPTIIVDNCQPQQEIFQNAVANKFCSFILTFRTCQEAIMIANSLYRDTDAVYLWTESISQCFSLKKQLNYNDIFVNIGQTFVSLTVEPSYKYICKGSFFNTKNAHGELKTSNSNEIGSKFVSLNKNSTWRTESFYYRYSRVVDVINKMTKEGILSTDGQNFLMEYLENKIKPFQFSYLIKDSLNKLTESFPIGNVFFHLGECDIDDIVVQSIILVWLFGNDLVISSENELSNVYRCFLEDGKAATLTFIKGQTYLNSLSENSLINSIICFDGGLSVNGGIMKDFKKRLLYKSLESSIIKEEFFGDLISFARIQKSLYILSGDVGIN